VKQQQDEEDALAFITPSGRFQRIRGQIKRPDDSSYHLVAP